MDVTVLLKYIMYLSTVFIPDMYSCKCTPPCNIVCTMYVLFYFLLYRYCTVVMYAYFSSSYVNMLHAFRFALPGLRTLQREKWIVSFPLCWDFLELSFFGS